MKWALLKNVGHNNLSVSSGFPVIGKLCKRLIPYTVHARILVLEMVNQKSKKKYHRIFFSTDIHASEVVFRKFISAASFYQVGTLIMG
jgi:CRISPR/Cas system CSM-associated protein Csm4 (group 5 of RAMP superfamily)